jgi:hypothetical protein
MLVTRFRSKLAQATMEGQNKRTRPATVTPLMYRLSRGTGRLGVWPGMRIELDQVGGEITYVKSYNKDAARRRPLDVARG